MRSSVVRLSQITIQNFKNVKKGRLILNNRRVNYRSNILGLYGQNGSGKTALIDALQLLKYVICGKSVPAKMADYINVDAEYATLTYTFHITGPLGKYEAFYEVNIRKEENVEEQNADMPDSFEEHSRIAVFNEILSYSFEGEGEKIRKSPLINTRAKIFGPLAKFDCLIGKSRSRYMDLIVAKRMAANTSRSFVFSRDLINILRKRRTEGEHNTEFIRHLSMLEDLIVYGNNGLFVINTRKNGMISMNALPMALYDQERDNGTTGHLMLPLEEPAVISDDAVVIVNEVISTMNIVLERIVPGMTINLKHLNTHTLESGKIGSRIQLMSHKNSKEIPLKYESEGIKKIISILHLLIVIYNHPSVTVAIDDLDAGVFEYLFGEILSIIAEKGKGQLIFTAHNLRTFETLDRGFIAVTTTNPVKKYTRMSNMKDINNLRDFYYRDIVLGEQTDKIYEPTNSAEIALAFRAAGEIGDS